MNPATVYKTKAQGSSPGPLFLLAHGAGAPADSAFMGQLAEALSVEGVTTVRFEFPYMSKRRQDGKKRPPDRQPVLLDYFREVIADARMESSCPAGVFVGGKSMGGRMASLIAAQADGVEAVRGAVCFGYPFHPPGKPDRWRTDHFADFGCPVQIIQGTRDPFGRQAEVEQRLSGLAGLEMLSLAWLEGGDHDYRPLAKQKGNQTQLIQQAATLAARFMQHCV